MASKTGRATKKRSSADSEQTKKFFSLASALLMFLGVGLIVCSFIMQSLPNEVVWSREQAIAHQNASNQYHRDQFDQSISKTDLEHSREEFEEIDSKLKRAKNAKTGLPRMLRLIGIGSSGVGFIVMMVLQSNKD